jgi:hypothetical protein
VPRKCLLLEKLFKNILNLSVSGDFENLDRLRLKTLHINTVTERVGKLMKYDYQLGVTSRLVTVKKNKILISR